jgi:hypothetical protein
LSEPGTSGKYGDYVASRVKLQSKRADPAWKPYTLMLKIKTHAEADIILRRMDTRKDLSDLAQELFEQWVSAHSQGE